MPCLTNAISLSVILNFLVLRKTIIPLTKHIREEVQHYLENADDRMLKIGHAILEADSQEDFWDELPITVQDNIHTAIKQSEKAMGRSHKEVMSKYTN